MKIVDAVWEKRNLGVSCTEIAVHDSDSLAELESAVHDNVAQYMVIKIPSTRPDLVLRMSELGFAFVECLIHMSNDLSNTELSGIWQRLNRDISHHPMDDTDKAQLFDELKKGLFHTDRVYIDPHFGEELAAQRYINWIEDELARGCQIYKICLKDKSIGFFTFKETEPHVYFPFLAGLYADYSSSGLGFAINQKALEEAVKRNGKKVYGYISTNNPAIVKLQHSLGYTIGDTQYVFIRHN